MLTLITFIIILSVLVFAHELGHFVTARKFGVKAEEFGFGFPPRILGVYRNKEKKWRLVSGSRAVREEVPGTIYSINWIPLGGFVKIKGEDGDNNDPDSFANKKIWKRATILSAGVSMNVILAAILISIGLMIGFPQSLDGNINPKATVTGREIEVVQVLQNSPAEKAGIKEGDLILSINNIHFSDYAGLENYVNQNTNKELTYDVKRASKEMDIKVTPRYMQETKRGGIGVAISEYGIVRLPWYMAIWEGIKTTLFLTWAIIVAFYELLKNLILGHGVSADLAGPVRIAQMTGEAARMGIDYVLQFAALLSINLAIINFIPFPALDGGRVLFLVFEKIKGKPVKRELEALIHNMGFVLLMILILLVTANELKLKYWIVFLIHKLTS